MKKINKTLVFIILFFYFFTFNLSKIIANEDHFFLTLKNDEVNLRLGPSLKHPIKLIYNKKYLPVIILDKSETWRKIKDFENNSGWIHISQLSKKKSAINMVNNSLLYKKSTIYSKPIAKLEKGKLVLIKKCKDQWCKVMSDEFVGWILKINLWGRI
tara:strand:+ start:988 stop:1458 length:471 start_codon:yes stop_codon:yes gene_type:complete